MVPELTLGSEKFEAVVFNIFFVSETPGYNFFPKVVGVYFKFKKAILIISCGGLYGYKMLMIPHFIDNRLTDGGKVVSPTHQPHFTPQKYYFSTSSVHFC
jgi:hypothetical protein